MTTRALSKTVSGGRLETSMAGAVGLGAGGRTATPIAGVEPGLVEAIGGTLSEFFGAAEVAKFSLGIIAPVAAFEAVWFATVTGAGFFDLKKKSNPATMAMKARTTQNFFISGSFHESEVRRGEASDVRENGGEVAAVHAEPGRDGGEILVDGRGGNPAAGAGVVRAADGERGKFAISLPAFDPAAHDEVVAAPAVIAAHTVGRKGAAKIAGGERRHF